MDGSCTADGAVGSTTFPPPSDGTLFPGASSAGAFVGRVVNASDGADGDNVNTSDIAGSATFPADPASFDWLGFEHPLRTWGREGTDAPNGAARGLWQSGVGRVWDWRLVPSTSNLYDDTLDPRDGNGGPFIAGQECPQAAHGGYAVHSLNAAGAPEDYLASGIEIVEDNVGDNDGLCESAERCIYAPHFGACQGEGTQLGPCGFVDVTDGNPTSVEDVTLFGFSSPGA